MAWIETRHRYLPLDTLRTVAFGLVFLHHTLPDGLIIGRSGVDLFFVLSGYLITGGLLRSAQGPGWFSRFFARRALRIAPAYYLGILLAAVLVPASLDGMVPWSVVYLGNLGYSVGGHHSALAHLWSLAVEEQFYLLWPLALWWVRSPAGRWRLVAGCVLLAPLVRLTLASGWNWQASYSMLPARMDGLAIGAGIALLEQSRGVSWFVEQRSRLLGGTAVLGVLVLLPAHYWSFTSTRYQVVTLSLTVLCFGLLVATTIGMTGTRVARAMSLTPVVYVGQISYGLYLFHNPVLVLLRPHLSWPAVMAVGGALTLAIAMVSFHLVERPVNELRHRYASRTSRSPEPATA